MAISVIVTTFVTGPFLPFLSRATVLAIAGWWCRVTLGLLKLIVGLDLEIRGRENIPEGAAIVAVKHQSALETYGLFPTLRDPTFVLKRELTWIPFFGWFLLKLRMIAINRSTAGEALVQMLEQAGQVAAEGRQIVIYPEGTRRAVGEPPRYRFGVGHLYERLNVPCVPVAVDTGLFYPRDKMIRRQGRAVIQFLEPIPPGMPRDVFFAELRDRIEVASRALLREAEGDATATTPHGASRMGRELT